MLKPGVQNLVAGKLRKLKLPLRYEPGAAPLQLDGEAYRGALVVHGRAGKLTVVNKLPLDRYLRGVVPWEMPDDWHPEALRAQSVVARSYALATLKPNKLFDLYADTRSQVYGGIRAEEDSTNRAIGSTAGQVVSWQGRVATTFYHSTSGGRTVSNVEAWPGAGAVPYLVSVPDPLDRSSKHHAWGPFELTPAEVGRQLGLSGVRDLVLTRGPAGRATEVTIRRAGGVKRMSSTDFRRALDLRSTWFTVRVLHLEQTGKRALAAARQTVVLRGFVRGLRRVRLERQVNGGTWMPVRRVRPRADGWFKVTLPAGRTASYRLANHVAVRRGGDRKCALRASNKDIMDAVYGGSMRYVLTLAAALAAFLALSAPADASRFVRYGLQDDAWIAYGPGTLDERLDKLDRMGVKLVRYTLNWHEIEARKGRYALGSSRCDPARTERARDGAGGDDLGHAALGERRPLAELGAALEVVVRRLRRACCRPLSVRPELADLERAEPAPLAPPDLAEGLCADAAEPGLCGDPPGDARCEGGRGCHRSPRRVQGHLSGRLHPRPRPAPGARLDAYAHNPYPLHRLETPTEGGCGHCETITMATIDRLLREVRKAFGPKRIWLTEYGYQTNPPDPLLGVSRARQARHIGEAALRAYQTPYVDMLIQYLYKDEPNLARWQSGLVTAGGAPKLSLQSAILPFAQLSRDGLRTVVWGQIRPERRARALHPAAVQGRRVALDRRTAYDQPAWLPAADSLGRKGRQAPALVSVRRHREPAPDRPLVLDPARATALEKGAQALLALGARAALGDPARGLGAVGAVEDELLRVPRRPGPGARKLGEHLFDRGVEVGGDLVHEPDPEGGRSVETLARDEVPSRRARPDLRQCERRDHGRDDAELHLREGEDRPLVRDGDVRARHQAGAASQRVPLDAGHDRRRTAVDRLEHRAQCVRVRDVRVEVEVDRGPHPLDVRAGAEARAVACEQDRTGFSDVDERLGELGDQGGVEGVPGLGPRERDPEHVAVPFDPERTHAPTLRRPHSIRDVKRHPALVPLSHDHHHTLVRARELRRAAADADDDGLAEVAARFRRAFRGRGVTPLPRRGGAPLPAARGGRGAVGGGALPRRDAARTDPGSRAAPARP